MPSNLSLPSNLRFWAAAELHAMGALEDAAPSRVPRGSLGGEGSAGWSSDVGTRRARGTVSTNVTHPPPTPLAPGRVSDVYVGSVSVTPPRRELSFGLGVYLVANDLPPNDGPKVRSDGAGRP